MEAETFLSPVVTWVGALALFLSFATNIWSIVGSGSRNNARRLDEVGGRLDSSEARLASVEQTLRGMPGKDDIHAVHLSLAAMSGDLKTMQATMSGSNEIMKRLETIVTRHEDHLLGGAKR